jgi:hypothetical protein
MTVSRTISAFSGSYAVGPGWGWPGTSGSLAELSGTETAWLIPETVRELEQTDEP